MGGGPLRGEDLVGYVPLFFPFQSPLPPSNPVSLRLTQWSATCPSLTPNPSCPRTSGGSGVMTPYTGARNDVRGPAEGTTESEGKVGVGGGGQCTSRRGGRGSGYEVSFELGPV